MENNREIFAQFVQFSAEFGVCILLSVRYFIEVATLPVYIKCSTMGPCSNWSRKFNVLPSQLNTANASNKSDMQFGIFF